ncbi:MAG TPA: hypothetical protein PKZ12_00565 [Smithellaceae bacterium]|nr:hypothetical protein [Smithellaceae bacterium]
MRVKRIVLTGIVFCFFVALAGCASGPQVAPAKVQVPADVQAFFDKFAKDIATQKMDVIGANYSDKFMQNGFNKEGFLYVLSGSISMVTKYSVKLTKYEVDKNNPNIAHIEGSADLGFMTADFVPGSMMIKENGEWKWYGNQK